MKSWLKWGLSLLAASQLPTQAEAVEFGDDGDSMFTLVLLQMITQRDNQYAMQSLYPLLLSSIMGDSGSDNKAMYYLLLGAGTDSNMQQWLPLILNNKDKSTSDKLLMMIFMQQAQVGGGTDMNAMFPLLLLNGNDNKYCSVGSTQEKCTCKDDNSEMLLYIMLLNGNQFGAADNNYSNFMFMMFDNDNCEGLDIKGDKCLCDENSEIEGGIDAVTYLMMMQMNPVVKQQLPESPPQRAIDIKDLLKKQLFANLGPEYQWMQNAQSTDTSELVKFQLYQQMGIPPNVMSILANGSKSKTNDEKFALIQWMSQGTTMSIETMSLMLGIEDAKSFYIHSMIEDGNVDPMTASLLLASQGKTSKEKMKEMLIMAATGQIDPSSFATIAKPYVPELPQGTYPGQELYFIHLEMMDLNTCALIEPTKRKACGKNFGKYVTAEQCEVHPYCCYNPYFGKNEAGNQDDSVPWCYYNIFFVFHDQYKLRIKEADQFKGPQDCPGLFRYGLNLDPFMYYTAVNDLQITKKALGDSNYVRQISSNVATQKLAKLIHLRQDVGFAGITEFHCRAIMGACWDSNAPSYPAQYGIPQCYEEASIDDGTLTLNLYDPQLFKPVVPAQFRAEEGECDTNYFHVSTLYYERRACTYDIEMIKYGTDYSPLAEPTREDCLFRLGCCYEDNEEVMQKYPFMPRCYQRVKDDKLEVRVFQTKPVLVNDAPICGSQDIVTFINKVLDPINGADKIDAVVNYQLQWLPDIEGVDSKSYQKLTVQDIIAKNDPDTCLYMNTNTRHAASDCKSQDDCVFWQVFDLFNKDVAKDYYKKFDGIPLELQNMVNDLF
jgi:hypothetical protein